MSEENTVPDVYINNVKITGNIYELMIYFALATPQDDGTTSEKEIIRIRMSPQQALAFSTMLNNNLKVYNETFKEIFLPESLLLQLKGEKPVQPESEEKI